MKALTGVTIFAAGLFIGHAMGTIYGAALQKSAA
jgi:hypothetical protein